MKNPLLLQYILFSCLFIPISFLGGTISIAKELTGDMRLKYEYQHFIIPNVEDLKEEIIDDNKDDDSKDFCTEENIVPQTDKEKMIIDISSKKIEQYLEENIAPEINESVNNVRIFRDENNKINFDGYAQIGTKLDIKKSAELIAYGIRNNIDTINLSVEKTIPTVMVDDDELKKIGIKDLISTGRSDFYPSSAKRIQNIMAGAEKFNGQIIKKDEIFSFNTSLGLVDSSTGYAKEYVILGDRVEKEYGGGLCQVSSTAYRGIMLAGLKIVERHNHSFAINHYKPYGSDATIYQGVKDFRWQNDSDGDILIQTRKGGKNDSELFFYYYGTPSNREVQILGPTFKNYRTPPANKITYSLSLPEGTQQNASSRVQGFDSSFGRNVTKEGKEVYKDTFFSPYQARGNWVVRGGSAPVKNSSDEIARAE